ncbi:MAG TPA: hypothetical protein VGC13_31920 [Longimicrobium sp.]|jgi:hypothetical protein|uniref:hypothetical protein n=1 Tax=Longimicrobium sp. TaxID=2029185 RepID=UPI002EDA7562
MSRVRVSYVLAFFGILISTGGCSNSATAPEAATAERVEASSRKAPEPVEETETGEVTVQSGYISVGG